jgi:phage virion morphogenesis protein
MSGVRGNLRALERLAAGMEAMAQDSFRAQLAEQFAEEALDLTMQAFREQADPYGNGWAPLQEGRGRGSKSKAKILQDTRTLRNSIGITSVSAQGFKIGTGVVYAAVHQYGHAFAPRMQAAIRTVGGQLMFVREDSEWGWESGNRRWQKILRKAGYKFKRGAARVRGYDMPEQIGKVAKVFYVEVAPVIPARPYLPTNGLPPRWKDAFAEVFTVAVQKLVGK